MPNPDDLLPISDAAALLGVGPDTLRRWTKDGRIKAVRTLGQHRRYRRKDVERLLIDPAREQQAAS